MALKTTILILSPRFPYPLEKGDKLRLYNQLLFLKDHFKIVLVTLSEDNINENDIKHINKLVDKLYIIKQSKLRTLKAIFNSLVNKVSIQESYYYENKIQKRIDKIIRDSKPELVYVQLIRVAKYLDKHDIPKYIDFMDAMSVNMERESEKHSLIKRYFYKREARMLKQSEIDTAKKFDACSIISATDKDVFNNYGITKVEVITNGVDLEYFNKANFTVKLSKYKFVFVGNMGYLPNVEAAIYLIQKIQEPFFPDSNVLIAGVRPHKRVKALASDKVTISGWVDDIRTAYLDGDIVVAPIFTGAGQQNKILEGMAMGKVCISTSMVANAIGAEDMKHILIADSPKEFQLKIEKISSDIDLKKRIEENARIFVELNYKWKNKVNKLVKELKNIQ